MKKEISSFIDMLSDPIFILDLAGNVKLFNESARYIMNNIGSTELEDYVDVPSIIYEMDKNNCKKKYIKKEVIIKKFNIKKQIYLFKLKMEDTYEYLLCFKNISYDLQEMKEVLNAVDVNIAIFDGDGKYISCNTTLAQMLYENLGINVYNMVGVDNRKLVELGLAEDSIADEVIKKRKTIVKNITYKNKKTITYTGTPIIMNNKVHTVVVTGKDVSELISLRKNIEKVKTKNEEYIKKIEEIKNKESIIYSSKEMETIINVAKRVAPTDSSIFIRGSSGVGKEEIAKYIHQNSLRKNNKFIAVNCAAIPSELLEMEFFGYEEGAFTGAKKGGKVGLLEIANGGTIFLDEIGELPLQMQSKLLRAIQEDGFMRIGGSQFINTDIRYISATNISEQDIFDGIKFRQDLYYRVSVVPISIPDIKDRKADIIPLTSFFINNFNEKYRRNIKVTKEAISLFIKYDWPGNVREIKNIMERLIILVEDEYIKEDDFTNAVNLGNSKLNWDKMISMQDDMKLDEAHELLDKILIENAVEKHGSVIAAAKVLDVAPSTIHRKLKKSR